MTKFYNKKNVHVTGGSGFIGSNLIKRLIKINVNVFSTIHNSKPQIIDKNIIILEKFIGYFFLKNKFIEINILIKIKIMVFEALAEFSSLLNILG